MRVMHMHIADQYEAMAKEITQAKDQTTSSEMSLSMAGEMKLTVIGSDINHTRSQQWDDDLAELERRTAALRAERQAVSRP